VWILLSQHCLKRVLRAALKKNQNLKIRFSSPSHSVLMPERYRGNRRTTQQPTKGNIMHALSVKAVAALALSTLSLGAFASTYDGTCTNEPKSKWMAPADVKTKFEAQGYTVGRVKTGGTCYEVYTKGKDGAKLELFVNPVNGAVVGQADKK
jgi:hypothetical protein